MNKTVKHYTGGYTEICQEYASLKSEKNNVQFNCNLHMFMSMAAVIIQVTSGPMAATFTNVTMVNITTKVTNFPMINFATIIVKIADVDWMLWLQEGAITLSLCTHFPFPLIIFPFTHKPSKPSPSSSLSNQTLYVFLFSSTHVTCFAHIILRHLITLICGFPSVHQIKF